MEKRTYQKTMNCLLLAFFIFAVAKATGQAIEMSDVNDLVFRSPKYCAIIDNRNDNQEYAIISIFDTTGANISFVDSRKDTTLQGWVYNVSLSDRSFAVLTNKGEDCFLVICYDVNGTFLWKRDICQENMITDRTIILSPNGNYAIQTSGKNDFILLDGNTGKELKTSLISLKGGYLAQFNYANDIIVVSDNGYIIKYNCVKDSIIMQKDLKLNGKKMFIWKDWWSNEDRTFFATRVATNGNNLLEHNILLAFDGELNFKQHAANGIFAKAKITDEYIFASVVRDDRQIQLHCFKKGSDKDDTVKIKTSTDRVYDVVKKNKNIIFTQIMNDTLAVYEYDAIKKNIRSDDLNGIPMFKNKDRLLIKRTRK